MRTHLYPYGFRFSFEEKGQTTKITDTTYQILLLNTEGLTKETLTYREPYFTVLDSLTDFNLLQPLVPTTGLSVLGRIRNHGPFQSDPDCASTIRGPVDIFNNFMTNHHLQTTELQKVTRRWDEYQTFGFSITYQIVPRRSRDSITGPVTTKTTRRRTRYGKRFI